MADAAASVERGPTLGRHPTLGRRDRQGGDHHAALAARVGGIVGRLWCLKLSIRRRGSLYCERLLATALGLGVFLVLAPGIAMTRQVAVLVMAGLVGSATDLVENNLLPLLPVDPVYGGAGLRVLGGIEPRGLAVAGQPGALLHWLLPVLFGPPELTAADAVVSALVGPGVTVLARTLTALFATTALLVAGSHLTTRLRRPAWTTAATLAQLWLLLDLAHETDLGVRDLEATGLPFALAAFAPVDAAGQRVMLTTHLEALPDGAIGCLSAALAVAACLLGTILLRSAVELLVGGLNRHHRPEPSPESPTRPIWLGPRMKPDGLSRLGVLAGFAIVVSMSPIGALADGEMAILMPPPVPLDESASPVQVAEAPSTVSTAAAASGPTPITEPTAAPAIAPTATPAATGSLVAVEGGGYQYTLRVDGRPMVVRGMGYNPWYASLPLEERQQRYKRDFSTMHEIGVNTLEGWFQDQFDEVTLDEAQRQGLKVILPFELNQDYDYSDPDIKARFRQQVTDWVLRYRDHPGLLMWGPGNEVMHRLIFPTAVQGQRDLAREKRADDFAAFYVELIDMVRALDPNHPVIYRDAEDLYFARLRTALLQDGVRRPWFIYGTNVYTMKLADVIERWPSQGLDAPLVVSEFSPGGSGAAERPGMFAWYWSTIRAHPERVLGGVVYTWTTQGPEDLDRMFGLTNGSGAPVDGSIEALRQLFREDVVGRRRPS